MCQPTPLAMRHAGPGSCVRDKPRQNGVMNLGAPEILIVLLLVAIIGLPIYLVVRAIRRPR